MNGGLRRRSAPSHVRQGTVGPSSSFAPVTPEVMKMNRSSLSLAVSAALATLGAVVVLAGVAEANDVASRDRCMAKGNTAEACDCYVVEVNRRVQAKVKPETYRAMKAGESSKEGAAEDMSAMGVLIEANVDAAKKCGVKLK